MFYTNIPRRGRNLKLYWISLMEQYWTTPNASTSAHTAGVSKSISIFWQHSGNQGSAHFSWFFDVHMSKYNQNHWMATFKTDPVFWATLATVAKIPGPSRHPATVDAVRTEPLGRPPPNNTLKVRERQ